METTDKKNYFFTTGRRKKAAARIKFIPEGKGIISINGRKLENYFSVITHQTQVKKSLLVTKMLDKVNVKANVKGGGISGQAGAISLGIARALLEFDPDLRSTLRKEDLLTRDPRAKERKKYGRKGARRRFQWTKR
ncbi:MAG: 30S ribosomal protein S9 [Candidatus Omnitrophica bacterium]|nr:30S ribosomal protein S9 [Candidatus Omnitrophota bacterium]